jgi:hypothetical protein
MSRPTSSTMPIASWPSTSPALMKAPIVSYRWRSDPQMFVLVTLMIASFGSLITGSATSSTEMSRKPCQVTAFIVVLRLTPVVTGQMRAGLRAHLEHAAVDDPGRSCHVTGLRAREECDHRCDLEGVAGSTERDAEPFLLMGISVLLASHGGCDLARSDGIRGDLVLAKLEGEGFDQSADPVLSGVVGAGSDAWLVLVDAGDRDQPAAVAGLDHVACRMQTKVPSKLVAMIFRHSS